MNDAAQGTENAASVPAHVPPELVREFDYMHVMQGRDLYAWWAQLHDFPEIFFTTCHGGHWVLTRHEDIAAVLANHEDFSSRHQTVPTIGKPIRMAPIEYDPPLHMDFRRLLAPFFTPKAIGHLEGRATNLARKLIDDLAPKGECDFVADFSLAMPIGIFMGLVNLPDSDRLFLLECAEDIVRGITAEQQMGGFQRAFDYLGKKFTARAAKPGDDMLSAILQGTVEGGRPMTQEELLGMGALLLAGGLDTVAGMMGFMMLHLAEHPEHRRELIENPDIIPQAVEELMRRFQIANVAREVKRDTTYRGVFMKSGDMVLTPTAMSSIDERQYPDPMTVDFGRANKRSLVFGNGPHQCIGAFLARTELRVFLREWLARIPDFRIKDGDQPVVVAGRANSVHYLPLVWEAGH